MKKSMKNIIPRLNANVMFPKIKYIITGMTTILIKAKNNKAIEAKITS